MTRDANGCPPVAGDGPVRERLERIVAALTPAEVAPPPVPAVWDVTWTARVTWTQALRLAPEEAALVAAAPTDMTRYRVLAALAIDRYGAAGPDVATEYEMAGPATLTEIEPRGA